MARSPGISNLRIRPEFPPSNQRNHSGRPSVVSPITPCQRRSHHGPCPRSCASVHRRVDGLFSVLPTFFSFSSRPKGTTITLDTKTGQRLEGVVVSTNGEGDTAGVTLKDVKEVSNPVAPLKTQFFIASTNIESWNSGPADAKLTNGDCEFYSSLIRHAFADTFLM